jgi:hypothetical protein
MVILAVVPAMSDFSNAEVISMAKKVDKDLSRTLGVVTKCDDAGNAKDSDIVEKVTMCRSSDVKLPHGFHCVINRSQSEVDDERKNNVDHQRSQKKQRENEAQVFATNNRLRQIPVERRGTDKLAAKIAMLQSDRIDECLPRIHRAINVRLKDAENSLKSLPYQPETPQEHLRRFNVVLRNICKDFEKRVEAKFMGTADQKEFAIAPQVASYVQEFQDAVEKRHGDWMQSLDQQVSNRMYFSRGYTVDNLTGSAVFVSIVQETFADGPLLTTAVETLICQVRDSVIKVLEHLVDEHCHAGKPFAYKHLAMELKECADFVIRSQAETTQAHCTAMVKAQRVTSTTSKHYSTTKFKKLIPEICSSLRSYSTGVLPGFVEMSSKVVQNNMIWNFIERFESHCRDPTRDFENCFPIDPDLHKQRASLETTVQRLRDAKAKLKKLPGIHKLASKL